MQKSAKWFLLLLGVALVGISYHLRSNSHVTNSLSTKADALSQTFQQFNNESALLQKEIRFNSQHQMVVNETENKTSNTWLIYCSDSVCYWNNNFVSINQTISSFPNGNSVQHFSTGWYYVVKKELISPDSNRYSSILICPVFYEYEINNEYLQNHFSKQTGLPGYYNITTLQLAPCSQILIPESNQKIFLSYNNQLLQECTDPETILFFFIGLLIIFITVNIFIKTISNEWLRFFPAVIFTLAIWFLFGNRLLLPAGVKGLLFFDPELFASPIIALSLASLTIKSVLVFWWIVILKTNSKLHLNLKNRKHFIPVFSLLLCIQFGMLMVVALAQAIIFDSNINYSLSNTSEFNLYGITGLFAFALCIISVVVFSFRIFRIIHLESVKHWITSILFLVASVCVYPLLLQLHLPVRPEWFVLFFFITNWLLFLIGFKNINEIKFTPLFFLLMYFSVTAGVLLSIFSHVKEEQSRLTFAKHLSFQRDNVTEFLLTHNRDQVLHDKVLLAYIDSGSVTPTKLNERVEQLFFRNGFGNYDVHSFLFIDSSVALVNDKFQVLLHENLSNAFELNPHQLYYKISSKGNLIYLSEYSFIKSGNIAATLLVQLSAKAYKAVNVYPELLLEQKDKLKPEYDNFSYSVYVGNQMVQQNGPLVYKSFYASNLKKDSSTNFIDQGGVEHLLYQLDNDVHIIVSSQHYPLILFVSTSSYLFGILFCICLFFFFMFRFQNVFEQKQFSVFKNESFRNIIQYSLFAFIIIGAMMTAGIAGRYFIKQYSEISTQKLIDKLKVAAEDVRVEINMDSLSNNKLKGATEFFNTSVNEYSNVQGEDINFYDLKGNLLASSQPLIFDRGLVSRKMNADAYNAIMHNNDELATTIEQIGTLEFLSGYMLLFDSQRNPLAILNIPYFNTNRELNEQLGLFFIVLINILVCSLILAGFITPIISNQIIKRVNFISQKFKQVNLQSANQLIVWETKDELGLLVDEFNKMILKLEDSAEKLARSERESAWREMARQVAHEIKNPLTPMKLSIQHLQKAIDEKRDGVDELTKRVSNLLIEQIDNLSKIATEFSNFNKIPEPQMEKLDLVSFLQSVVLFFNVEQQSHLHLKTELQHASIVADKKQLLQVFNNLVLNAFQAIEENVTPSISIILSSSEKYFLVEVNDNGSGISKETSSKIFTPYFTTKGSGTGLGLAITKTMIEHMNAKIWFTSHEGAGTSFFIQFNRINELS